jgi:hypothetical protein
MAIVRSWSIVPENDRLFDPEQEIFHKSLGIASGIRKGLNLPKESQKMRGFRWIRDQTIQTSHANYLKVSRSSLN